MPYRRLVRYEHEEYPAEWHTHPRLERTLLELAENIGVIKWEEN